MARSGPGGVRPSSRTIVLAAQDAGEPNGIVRLHECEPDRRARVDVLVEPVEALSGFWVRADVGADGKHRSVRQNEEMLVRGDRGRCVGKGSPRRREKSGSD